MAPVESEVHIAGDPDPSAIAGATTQSIKATKAREARRTLTGYNLGDVLVWTFIRAPDPGAGFIFRIEVLEDLGTDAFRIEVFININ